MPAHISQVSINRHEISSTYLHNLQPYITKTYFGWKEPPVNLAKIAIGDGALGNDWEIEVLPTVRESFNK